MSSVTGDFAVAFGSAVRSPGYAGDVSGSDAAVIGRSAYPWYVADRDFAAVDLHVKSADVLVVFKEPAR